MIAGLVRFGRCAIAMVLGLSLDSFGHAAPQGEEGSISESFRDLMKLRGKEYVAAREELLARPGVEKEIRRLSEETDAWDAELLCEALLYRTEKPELAKLFDRNHPSAGRYGWHGSRRWYRERPVFFDSSFTPELIACFGAELFAVQAEHLLWTKEWISKGTVDSLVQMRDTRVTKVLGAVARDPKDKPEIRGSCVWGLEECLRGIDARSYGRRTPFLPGHLRKLDHLYVRRDLPAFKITGPEREKVLQELTSVLANEKDAQVKVFAARALGEGDASAVSALARALRDDPSPWVRAWCVVSLRRIGGREATRALLDAMREERNAEVRELLWRTPLAPEGGLPRETILNPILPARVP